MYRRTKWYIPNGLTPEKWTSKGSVIQQDGRWRIGGVQEIAGVNCQGKTRAELLKNLRSALKEALEFKDPIVST